MIKIIKKNIYLIFIVLCILVSCTGKSHRINILGTYKNDSVMGYEAIVKNGTITIYSVSPFKKDLYWYGTCVENGKREKDRIVIESEKIDTGRNYGFFGGFGAFSNESQALRKTITFFTDSLTFVYDLGGINVREEKLYKVGTKHSNESNAEKIPELIPSDEYSDSPKNDNKNDNKNDKEDKITINEDIDNII